MDIGYKIKQTRLDKNIKQEDLASYLKMSQGTLSKIESDQLAISVYKLIEVAIYTKTPLNDLLPDGVNIGLKNNHDRFNDISTHETDKDKIELLQKHLAGLEQRINEQKENITELREKVDRKDKKIVKLKELISVLLKK